MATWMPKHVEDHCAIELHPENQKWFFYLLIIYVFIFDTKEAWSALTNFGFIEIKCLKNFFFSFTSNVYLYILCYDLPIEIWSLIEVGLKKQDVGSELNWAHKGPFT
jgi:hypothetical protein